VYVQPILLTTPLTVAAPAARSVKVVGAGSGSTDALALAPANGQEAAAELEISPEAEQQLKEKEAQAAASFTLSEEEQTQVDELKTRDREVRTHEQAHLAAAGPYAKGGPSFEYQQGPDGARYAIGGEVQIDTAPVSGDPEATLQKARVIRAAASAPAEPSGQDRAVAAQASQMEATARAELAQQNEAANKAGAGRAGNAGRPAVITSVGGADESEDDANTDDELAEGRPTIDLLA